MPSISQTKSSIRGTPGTATPQMNPNPAGTINDGSVENSAEDTRGQGIPIVDDEGKITGYDTNYVPDSDGDGYVVRGSDQDTYTTPGEDKQAAINEQRIWNMSLKNNLSPYYRQLANEHNYMIDKDAKVKGYKEKRDFAEAAGKRAVAGQIPKGAHASEINNALAGRRRGLSSQGYNQAVKNQQAINDENYSKNFALRQQDFLNKMKWQDQDFQTAVASEELRQEILKQDADYDVAIARILAATK